MFSNLKNTAPIARDQDEGKASHIPVLSDIPAIGRLFRSSNIVTNKLSVYILITPR